MRGRIIWSIVVLSALPVASIGQDQAASVTAFEISVDDEVLDDLRQRLERTRFPDQISGAGWDYGTELGYLRELIGYWLTEYDWRQQERRLNRFDQFTTEIDDLRVHFIHQRSKESDAMPLVITHGWPGSVFEFAKIIGPLTDPVAYGGRAEDAFHVICPSIPGYGFSGKPNERGFNSGRMGQVVAQLMARLGYERYGVQGGDWGSSVSAWLGRNEPDHVAGVHLNFIWIGPPAGAEDPDASLSGREIEWLERRQVWLSEEWGYGQIQGTKPQTLGYALNDSPAGLAAWLVEKFRRWSDSDGNVESRFSKDELITNVMLYWVTESITSSVRLYYEGRHSVSPGVDGPVEVPTAYAVFPKEVVLSPRSWVEARYNITRWTEMPRGGHFAALEEPELLVDDIRAFFRQLR